MIRERDDQKGHRKRAAHAEAGLSGLDAVDYKNRSVIERRYCHIKQ